MPKKQPLYAPMLATFGGGSIRGFGGGGAAGGGAVAGDNVEDLFSIDLYEGTGSNLTITNGVDLSGEGGLVIQRGRHSANTFLFDTESGATKYTMTASTQGLTTNSSSLQSFNSDGFTTGSYGGTNSSGYDYLSYSLRKKEGFFDVVKYTGNGTNGRTVSHNLNATVGMIWIKQIGASGEAYHVYHRSVGATKRMLLNSANAAATTDDGFYNTEPTSTEFTVAYNGTNKNGTDYIAYIWAHNDGDASFGATGDQDIVKCGSYTGNGSADGPNVDLGWEPQWVLVKRVDAGTENWVIFDHLRQMNNSYRYANNGLMAILNNTNAEGGAGFADPLPTGFKLSRDEGVTNQSGGTYIYCAIRRDMAVPTDATKVFDIVENTNGTGVSYQEISATEPPFPIDLVAHKWLGTREWDVADRMRGADWFLKFNNGDAEASEGGWLDGFDRMAGISAGSNGGVFSGTSDSIGYYWKRASGYFDIVAYKGDGSSNRQINHGLNATPEMIWIKNRSNATRDWVVYNKTLGASAYLELSNSQGQQSSSTAFNGTSPTDSVFSLGSAWANTNNSSYYYVAYLFASVDGVSHIGSYSGNGSSQNIDCGFSSTARFVLIKNKNATGNWLLWDAERGITSNNNDPYLTLNEQSASQTDAGARDIGPYSGGFQLTGADSDINASSNTYIFYAIA